MKVDIDALEKEFAERNSTSKSLAWWNDYIDEQFPAILAKLRAGRELREAIGMLVDVCPCQNGCHPKDMTCATRRSQAAIKQFDATKE